MGKKRKRIDVNKAAWRMVSAVASGNGLLAKKCADLLKERRRQIQADKLRPSALANKRVDEYFESLEAR